MIRRDALAQWKHLTEAAPAGPWRSGPTASDEVRSASGELLGELGSEPARVFTVAAREAMPALLAELEHLVALVRSLGNAQERVCPDCGPVDALGHKKRCRVAPYLR
jgi:hypothetical protein